MICTGYTVCSSAAPPPMPQTPSALQTTLQSILNAHAQGQSFNAPGISADIANDATDGALLQLWPSQLNELKKIIGAPCNQKIAFINKCNAMQVSEGCLCKALADTPDQQKNYFLTKATAQERSSIAISALYHATAKQIDYAIFINNIIYGGIVPAGIACGLLATEHTINEDKSFYATLLKPTLSSCNNSITSKTVCGAGITGLCLLSAYQTGLLGYLKTKTLPAAKKYLWNNRHNILWAPVNAINTFTQKPGKCLKVMSWPAVLLFANWIARGDKSLIGHIQKHHQKGIVWSMWDQIRATSNGTLDLFANPN